MSSRTVVFLYPGVEQFLWNEVLRPASGKGRTGVDESDLPASAVCWSAVTHIVGDPWGHGGKHKALESDNTLDHKLIPKVIPLCNGRGIQWQNK